MGHRVRSLDPQRGRRGDVDHAAVGVDRDPERAARAGAGRPPARRPPATASPDAPHARRDVGGQAQGGVEEAARIDGAGPFSTYSSVVLPMATPALITLVILSFQGSWNELSHLIVAAQSPELPPELTPVTKGVAQLAFGRSGPGQPVPAQRAAPIMTIPVAVPLFGFPAPDHEHHDGCREGATTTS